MKKETIEAIFIILVMIILSILVVSASWDASAVACGEDETMCRIFYTFR